MRLSSQATRLWSRILGERPIGATRVPPGLACRAALLLVAVLAGCRQDLATQYGQRKGPGVTPSVNGTAVLSEMFEHEGHTVFSWNSLSPKLERRADVIVWFPDDFQPPGQQVRDWLDAWLSDKPGRTLIYVGRDFDAANWYWDTIGPRIPPQQAGELQTLKSEAKTVFLTGRSAIPKSEDCQWFTVQGSAKHRKVQSLQGKPEWVRDVAASQVAIELYGRMIPPEDAEILLRSEKDVLVSRQEQEHSQRIVVANGSFLLNAPLANHENRKLAGHLIDEVGPAPKTVVFLESYAGGPMIRDDDSFPRVPTGMEIFHVWPTNWILVHFAIVGILFCFARYPIFGPPRQPKPEDRSDFGKHIEALGEMLQRSEDTTYAFARLLHYRQISSEAGKRSAQTDNARYPLAPPSPSPTSPETKTSNPEP